MKKGACRCFFACSDRVIIFLIWPFAFGLPCVYKYQTESNDLFIIYHDSLIPYSAPLKPIIKALVFLFFTLFVCVCFIWFVCVLALFVFGLTSIIVPENLHRKLSKNFHRKLCLLITFYFFYLVPMLCIIH